MARATSADAYTVVRIPEAEGHADAPASRNVDEVVVTAFGRPERLRDVPVSVQTTTGDEVVRQAITDPVAFASRQPAFRISPSPASEYISVRGVGSSANVGFEQSVGTFLDGVYRGRSRDIREAIFDLDRIELLRGPQTTFFGNNTIAGALNLISRKPGDVYQANGSVYYSPNFGEYSAELGADVPVSDRLSFRIAARQSGSDGYIHNTQTGQDGPELNDQIGRVSMVWRPNEIVEVESRIDVGKMRDKGVFNIELYNCPPPVNVAPASGACARYLASQGSAADTSINDRSGANASFFNYDFVELASTERIKLGSQTLSFTTGYFDRTYDLLNDAVAVPGVQGGSVVGTTTTLPILIDEKYRQFSQEIRLSSDAAQRLSYIGGLYYQSGKLDVDLNDGLYFAPLAAATRGLLPATTPVAGEVMTDERSETASGFLAGTYRPIDRLKINLSARYTRVAKSDFRSTAIGTAASVPTSSSFIPFAASTQAVLYGPAGISPGNYANPSQTSDRFLPSASVQYDLSARTMVYVSYSEGFKAGGYSIGNSSASFKPETVQSYETGLKAAFFGGRADMNLAGFYSLYTNLQETVTIAQGTTFTQVVRNAAKSNVTGLGLNANLRPAAGFLLRANLTALSAKYDDYKNGPCTIAQLAVTANCVQDLSGKTRAFAPDFSGNISASYTRALTSDLGGTIELMPYFSTAYFVTPTADPLLRQGGFVKVDARIELASQRGQWSLALIGRNLNDVRTASFRSSVTTAAGSTEALPDPPRSIGVQLNVKFR
jgi:outer membrane receptor protein involved in Fe transport